MRLEFLLLVAAAFPSCLSQMSHGSRQDSRQDSRHNSRRSMATPRLLPAPLVLRMPPGLGPPRIRCLAPRRFSGSTFELFQGISALPVQSVPAAPDHHWAEFSLPGAARCFWCRYRSHNGSVWLESELSPGIGSSDLGDAECHPSDAAATGLPPTAGALREVPSWLLPVSVGAAVLGLLLLLAAVAVAWQGGQGAQNREFRGGSTQGPPPRPAGLSWPPVPPVLLLTGVRRRRGQSHTVPAPSFPMAPAPAPPAQ
ncbi:uncharacterized protein LOC121661034 isoform X1 [Corvus kubaryi]|uniref:uncharacterized protein LOC121661034 isoform X1 n=1 Tax=Corvus kubaryi TaxID=68294 RepID=UPI001C03DB1A|nr:uncharacterized protein LOC121661034 isoform X1 [Corvus kubaryi]